MPGAVFWYHPCHVAAYYGYPATGYFFTPAYYTLRTVPAQVVAASSELEGVSEGIDRLRRSVDDVSRGVGNIKETSFFSSRGFAGATRTVIDVRGKGLRDAELFYVRGARLYWDGQYTEALANLRAAVTLRDKDGRYWSFKALAERALGDEAASSQSVRKAAELRRQDLPDAEVFGLALERVQGAERRFLEAAMK
jgi:hypothetical protein